MKIKKVTIIGGGTIGAGIATITAKSGRETVLVEIDQAHANAALDKITHDMDKQIARWGMTESEKKLVLTNLKVGDDLKEAKDSDLVISAIPDNLELKRQILQELNAICPADTIFSTSTSVLSITELATALKHPEKMIGLHFMNPVFRSKLVEIVRGFKTSDETYQAGNAFITSLGKRGVEVVESPGFITTRLIVPLINEAMYALMEGVASAEDIDVSMKLGFGMHSGPLELADRIGLDTLLSMMNHLFKETGDLKFRPCPLIKKLVRAEHLGVKTGEGFFTYDQETGKRKTDSFATNSIS